MLGEKILIIFFFNLQSWLVANKDHVPDYNEIYTVCEGTKTRVSPSLLWIFNSFYQFRTLFMAFSYFLLVAQVRISGHLQQILDCKTKINLQEFLQRILGFFKVRNDWAGWRKLIFSINIRSTKNACFWRGLTFYLINWDVVSAIRIYYILGNFQ